MQLQSSLAKKNPQEKKTARGRVLKTRAFQRRIFSIWFKALYDTNVPLPSIFKSNKICHFDKLCN